MTRLIDADELKKAFEDCIGDCACCVHNTNDFEYCGLIDNAPTVDIKDQIAGAYNEGYMCGNKEAEKARPQGEWITRHKLNSFGQNVECFECNKCGEYKVPLYRLFITEPLKICPNCGVDMRGANNG